MKPCKNIYLPQEAFGSHVACLGEQLARLLKIVGGLHPTLTWYVAHVEPTGTFPIVATEPMPVLFGDTNALIEATQRVDQFLAGAFAGVPNSIETPRFRDGGLWTEDEDDADIGDAIIEMRAFDTWYWIIAVSDAKLATGILEHLGVADNGPPSIM